VKGKTELPVEKLVQVPLCPSQIYVDWTGIEPESPKWEDRDFPELWLSFKAIATDYFITANLSDLSACQFHVVNWFSVTAKIKNVIQEMEISPTVLYLRRSNNN